MATIKTLLYTSKVLKNGEHPIMIRLIKDRRIKYISVGHTCHPDLWDFKKELPKRKHPHYHELEVNIGLKLKEAKSLLFDLENEQKNFSLDEFKQKYKAQSQHISVFEYLDTLANDLTKAGRVGYANSHKDLKRILSRYKPDGFAFSDLNHALLRKIEQFFQEREMKENAMGVYFRTLRAVYNKAVADGYVKKGDSPFDDFKVSKFKAKTKKRAIAKEAVQLLAQVEVREDLRLFHSRNSFLFSFYCSGMNFVDVAMLTWDNITGEGEYLHYEREKTGDIFDIKLLPPALTILAFYRRQRIDKYVFPYLNEKEHKTPSQIHDRIEDRRKVTNKDLKKLALSAGINTSITTYTARHSFATTLKHSGVATGKISELMGVARWLVSFCLFLVDSSFDSHRRLLFGRLTRLVTINSFVEVSFVRELVEYSNSTCVEGIPKLSYSFMIGLAMSYDKT